MEHDSETQTEDLLQAQLASKILSRLTELDRHYQAKQNCLLSTKEQQGLEQGRLEAQLRNLEREGKLVEGEVARVERQCGALAERDGSPTDPGLHKLQEAVANRNALGDAMECVIAAEDGLEWMKQVQQLAKRQFFWLAREREARKELAPPPSLVPLPVASGRPPHSPGTGRPHPPQYGARGALAPNSRPLPPPSPADRPQARSLNYPPQNPWPASPAAAPRPRPSSHPRQPQVARQPTGKPQRHTGPGGGPPPPPLPEQPYPQQPQQQRPLGNANSNPQLPQGHPHPQQPQQQDRAGLRKGLKSLLSRK